MIKFIVGQDYGNDLTIKVISRSDKMIVFQSCFGEKRLKIQNYNNLVEAIYFKSWIITADEIFNIDDAAKISFFKAYCI